MLFGEAKKWHEGEKWEKFLDIYDRVAKEQYDRAELVKTSFGDTQVFISGNPENPPIALFHGFNGSSLMYGEWIVPKLSEKYFIIAIDTIGDMGRSIPRDGDPQYGPQTEQDVADWAVQVFDDVLSKTNSQQQQQVNLIGYSFGCFIATCVVQNHPERVGKMISMAPAGVYAPINFAWISRAICVGLIATLIPPLSEKMRLWFVEYMLANPENRKNMKRLDLLKAAGDAGPPKVNIKPRKLDVEELKKVNKSNPTLLIIGTEETVIDPKEAIETATTSGTKVKALENAGHLLFCEIEKEEVIQEIQEFLQSPF